MLVSVAEITMQVLTTTSFLLIYYVSFCRSLSLDLFQDLAGNIPEDGRLNFTGLAKKYAHGAEEHEITTEDGYIITIFRIPGNTSNPVLLMHGIFDCADSFLLRGHTSLAVALANEGYDVWVGNMRGNKYGRKHINLDPFDNYEQFFDYSVHEYGNYDLPAHIDYVLKETGQNSLMAAGHSEGTDAFFVLGSSRPEYNDKVRVMAMMAPICFLNNVKLPLNLLMPFAPLANAALFMTGFEEMFPQGGIEKQLFDDFCSNHELGYLLCAKLFIFTFVSGDSNNIEEDFFPVIVGHYLAGTSRKNLMHFSQQSLSRTFSMYDYGAIRNLAIYNSMSLPEYDLSKVRMDLAMYLGRSDVLSTIPDVDLVRSKISSKVVDYRIMEPDTWAHVDFIWGRSAHIKLYPLILDVFKKYLKKSKQHNHFKRPRLSKSHQ